MDYKKLVSLAETAISACVGDTSTVTGTGEVAEVARLALGFPARLVKSWGQELGLGKIEVDGIFCHSTPQAYWDNPSGGLFPQKHPELCDLLIVLDNYPSGGGRERRALLLQAKLGSGEMFDVSSGGPCVQRYMYANWPKFYLVGKPLPNLINIKLAPKTPGDCLGGRYALVDTSAAPGQWSLEATQAKSITPFSGFNDYAGKKSAPISLGEALVSMLKGHLGSPCIDDWGTLVAHLLKLAQERIAENRQPAAVKSTTTGVTLPHTVHASTFVNSRSTFDISYPMSEDIGSFLSRITHSQWREDIRFRSTLMSDEQFEPVEGFGVIHIRVKGAHWRNPGLQRQPTGENS